MNKEELKAMVAELLGQMEPQVKGGDYRPTVPQPEQKEGCSQAFVPDVTQIDLRKLYLTENPENGQEFLKLKSRTPARLGCGKAWDGPDRRLHVARRDARRPAAAKPPGVRRQPDRRHPLPRKEAADGQRPPRRLPDAGDGEGRACAAGAAA